MEHPCQAADCSGVSHRLDVEQSIPCSPMCVRAAGRRSEPSREHPCAIWPAQPPCRCGSQSFLGVRFRPNRRQANELVDSPFCPENVPIRAIIPNIHKGSLLFDWEHFVGQPAGPNVSDIRHRRFPLTKPGSAQWDAFIRQPLSQRSSPRYAGKIPIPESRYLAPSRPRGASPASSGFGRSPGS